MLKILSALRNMLRLGTISILFRKAISTGEHPLSDVLQKEAEYIRKQPDEAWKLILQLVSKAKSDLMLAQIAAGPLEDLLNQYPDKFILPIEEEARKDVRFRKCLTGVWESGIPLPIWKRMQASIA